MFSRVLPLEDLEQRSVMYWLPPGGQDNGVWATRWVIIAELEDREVMPIMLRLADADVGAYAARATASGGRRLYIDVAQYNRALDVLMVFLRATHPAPPPVRACRPRPSAVAGSWRRRMHPAVRYVLDGVGVVLFIAVMVGLAYLAGAQRIADMHSNPHSLQTPSP